MQLSRKRGRAHLWFALFLAGAMTSGAAESAARVVNTTPDAFLHRGAASYVVGTGGDEAANRLMAAQVRSVRDHFRSNAPIVIDTSIAAGQGRAAWPANAVVYGGSHVNRLMAALGSSLPFSLERGRLRIGDKVFEGDDYWLIAVIPARERDDQGPGYPEFLLYAGTGWPGVEYINRVHHGAEPILVANTQGKRLLSGRWERGANGGIQPVWFGQGLAPDRRIEQWREDLRTYAREMEARHKDFAKLTAGKQFSRQLEDLEKEVPQLTDQALVLRLARLTACLGIAHTGVALQSERIYFHELPLRLRWFSDGLWVTGAGGICRESLGCRVVRIGGKSPEELEAAVAPYISHENPAWLRHLSPRFMTIQEVLQDLNLCGADGQVSMAFAKTDGEVVELRVGAKDESVHSEPFVEVQFPKPLCAQHPAKSYWYEPLSEHRAIYVQYSRCGNAPGQSFKGFTSELFEIIDAQKITRMVVDLRFNGGGNSTIIKPMLVELKSRRALRQKGQFYVLTGPGTFSAGVDAALDLRDLGGGLVGAPTGGKPNCYGESPTFRLPNTGLHVSYCMKYFKPIRIFDPLSLEPAVPVSESYRQWSSGSDPVLEWVLKQWQQAGAG